MRRQGSTSGTLGRPAARRARPSVRSPLALPGRRGAHAPARSHTRRSAPARGYAQSWSPTRITASACCASSVYLHAGSASADLRDALHQLQARGAEVMVLDLRGNGGGPNPRGRGSSACWQGQARSATCASAMAARSARGTTGARRLAGTALVRIDAGTASVAELLAAALQDSGRAAAGRPADVRQGHRTSADPARVAGRRHARRGRAAIGASIAATDRALQCAGVAPDLVVPAPGRARECTSPDALQPDRLPPPLPTAGVVTLQTRADSEPVRAAIAQLTQPVPVR